MKKIGKYLTVKCQKISSKSTNEIKPVGEQEHDVYSHDEGITDTWIINNNQTSNHHEYYIWDLPLVLFLVCVDVKPFL